MPAISLAVCLYREKDMLARMLKRSEGCYDDLLVVHDGPDLDDVQSLVKKYNGRFFERPRAFQQEFHWPFAWEKARHDWILRLDADEFPSEALGSWIKTFRADRRPPTDICAYTCIVPLWNGVRTKTKRWPDYRIFLVNRKQVRHFGMVDQGPIPDTNVEHVAWVLRHEPKQPTYGFRYTLFNKKVRRWHKAIAESLTGKPTDLPCWRWDSDKWPIHWERIRKRPLKTALLRLLFYSPLRNIKAMLRKGEFPYPTILATAALQHFMTGLAYIRIKKEIEKKKV